MNPHLEQRRFWRYAHLVPAWLEGTDVWLLAHNPFECARHRLNVCCLHRRTDHAMRAFPQHWRGDRGIMERTCPHGVGHPDPDDLAIRMGRDSGVHGCDGCCGLTAAEAALAKFDHRSPLFDWKYEDV